MSNSSKWKDLSWGLIAQGTSLGAGILVLPALLHKLQTQEIGLWFIIFTIYTLTMLIDFSLGSSVSRVLSYALSGAKNIQKTGISTTQENNTIADPDLVQAILTASQKLYAKFSLILTGIFLSIGSIYFYGIINELPEFKSLMILWCAHVFACTLNFYFGYINAALYGFKEISFCFQNTAISKLAFLITSILFLQLDFGLWAPALALIISSITLRIIGIIKFKKTCALYLITKESSQIYSSKISDFISTLQHNVFRATLIAVGMFFIIRANTLICSKFLGLEMTASYGLSIQMFTILMSFGQLPFNNLIPLMSASRQNNDLKRIRESLRFAAISSVLLYSFGTLVIIAFGTKVVSLIHSNTPLLSNPQLILLSVILFFETIHHNCTTVLSTRNEIPHVKAYLFSGIIILIISAAAMNIFTPNIWYLLVSQAIVQLAFNNWYWPLQVWRDFRGAKPQNQSP